MVVVLYSAVQPGPPPLPDDRERIKADAMATKTSFAATSTLSRPQPAVPIERHPNKAELIATHLWPRVHSNSDRQRHPFVHDHESAVYGADPADLARRYPAALSKSGDEAWYFVTKVECKDGRGMNRSVHGGTTAATWHGETGFEPVVYTLSGKQSTGYVKRFSFLEKNQRCAGGGGRGVRNGWCMLELGLKLHGHQRGQRRHGQEEDEVVLCKLYRSRGASNGDGETPPSPEPSAEEGWAGAGLEIQWSAKGKRRRGKPEEPPAEEGWAKIGWGRKGKRSGQQQQQLQLKSGGDGGGGDVGRKLEVMKSCPRCHADLSALSFPKQETDVLVPKLELDTRDDRIPRFKVKKEMFS